MGRLADRVWVSVSGTPGTGAITLGAALSGYRDFATAGISNGDVVSYAIQDGVNWECGAGTYSSAGPTLTRTTIEASSSAGAAITATSSATVMITPLVADFGRKLLVDAALDDQLFDVSGTWTKPSVAGTWALVELWGAGQGGGKGATNSGRYGGVGGQWRAYMLPFALLPASASITIGAGGVGLTVNSPKGYAGGNTSAFGLTSFGGGQVVNAIAGYDAKYAADVTSYGVVNGASTAGVLFAPLAIPAVQNTQYNAPSDFMALSVDAARPAFGGGLLAAAEYGSGLTPVGSSAVANTASNPTYAGGRGAGATAGNVKINASTSTYGGAGGDSATTTTNTAGVAGSAPGGGGSAGTGTGNGGAGAAGRVRVRIY